MVMVTWAPGIQAALVPLLASGLVLDSRFLTFDCGFMFIKIMLCLVVHTFGLLHHMTSYLID